MAVTQVEMAVQWLLPAAARSSRRRPASSDLPSSQSAILPRAPGCAPAVTTSASAQRLSPARMGKETSW